jgi:hypothetical protein
LIHATRNLLIPVEPTGKGQVAVSGLEDLVENLEEDLGIEIGVLAAPPNRVKGTRDQEAIVDEIEALGFDVPVVIRDRASLLKGCWRQQCSAFTYVRKHRNRERDYDLDVWYFPSKLPELNAVEGCWDQLQEWFKHRLIPDLSTLEEYLPRGLDMIAEPDIWPYLTSKDSS